MRNLSSPMLLLTLLAALGAGSVSAQMSAEAIAPVIQTDDLPDEGSTAAATRPPVTEPSQPGEPLAAATLAATTTETAAPRPAVYADIAISNVTVVVSDSTGLERDKALELAARQALPGALAKMDPPVTGERADTFIKSQGDLTRYAKTVRIIKEVLVPSYTLTADLTFDGAKLYANLGGRIPAQTQASATVPTAASPTPRVSAGKGPKSSFNLQLASGSVADQSRLYRLLNQLPDTKARYTSITTQDATYSIETAFSQSDLSAQLTRQQLSVVPGSAGELRVSF